MSGERDVFFDIIRIINRGQRLFSFRREFQIERMNFVNFFLRNAIYYGALAGSIMIWRDLSLLVDTDYQSSSVFPQRNSMTFSMSPEIST